MLIHNLTKKTLPLLLGAALLLPGPMRAAEGWTIARQEIIAQGDAMANAQIAAFKGRFPAPDWETGIFWAGLADFSQISPKGHRRDAAHGCSK